MSTLHRLIAMHDARAMAALLGAPAPLACEWLAAPLDAPGAPIGAFVGGNPLADDWLADATLPGKWIMSWSGTLAPELFESTPANWMRGAGALDAFCDELGPQLAAHGKRLLLVPHARHVLSDARSALTWWCDRVIPGEDPAVVRRAPRGPRAYGLAIDPSAFLEISMIADIDDHLHALFGAFGGRADALILRDCQPSPADAQMLIPCRAGDGVLPRATVLALLEEFVPAETPILLPGANLDRSLAWLGRES